MDRSLSIGEPQSDSRDGIAENPYSTRRKPRQPYSDTVSLVSTIASPTGEKSGFKRKRGSTNASTNRGANSRQSEVDSKRNRLSQENVLGQTQYVYTLRDRTELRANDCIYLVCEPPGEPYYLGRIMEFTRLTQNSKHIDAIRVNWFYRPRDIQRQHSDSRLVFATMHSDLSPLSAIRGKCSVLHKSQIDDLDQYRRTPDNFYFERLFDKFMRRQYEVIPVSQVINVPEKVRDVLQRRWRYVVVEVNRAKELAMDHRACKRCGDWCASKDSVRCAICTSDYHLTCVQPPLPRKPTRGFAWTCTICSRAEAQRAENTQNGCVDAMDSPDLEMDREHKTEFSSTQDPAASRVEVSEQDAIQSEAHTDNVMKEINDKPYVHTPYTTGDAQEEQLWPYRYLGIHCNIDDAVDHDDRIYPRAASRIGPRYQAVVIDWPGRPVEYFDRVKRSIKRTAKAMKGKRSDERASLDNPPPEISLVDVCSEDKPKHVHEAEPDGTRSIATQAVQPSPLSSDLTLTHGIDKPPWLLERPANYLSRGEGRTSETIWTPQDTMENDFMSEYLKSLLPIAKKLRIDHRTPNFLDAALKALHDADYVPEVALQAVLKLTRASLSEPNFTAEEKTRFSDSVKRNGSELADVAHDVGTKSVAECVRFYYVWKKTAVGSLVWANSEARKPKQSQVSSSKIRSVSSNDSDKLGDSSDDSAYDTSKVTKLRKTFRCKYCTTTNSERWRRAPGSNSSTTNILALCNRCANLWRKYAVPWETPEELYKKLHEGGNRGKKRKFEEELLKELPANGERPDKHQEPVTNNKAVRKVKKAEREREIRSPSPILPDPCAVCKARDNLPCSVCRGCGLKVHNTCYGISDLIACGTDWTCDPCTNNAEPTASTDYGCVLCPVRAVTPQDPPGALKRTAANNWAHITCATWNPELRFGDLTSLQPIEGISQLPLTQWQSVCIVCNSDAGACVTCTTCDSPIHVECGSIAQFILGFDIQPVKSSQSRRDSLALVRLGTDNGLMTPVIHCPSHDLRRHIIHFPAKTSSDGGRDSALSLYNATYKGSNIPGGRRSRKALLPQLLSSGSIDLKSKHEELLATASTDESMTALAGDLATTFIVCALCKTQSSPFFHPRESDNTSNTIEKAYLCHKCHWQAQPLLVSNGNSYSNHCQPAVLEKVSAVATREADKNGAATSASLSSLSTTNGIKDGN